MSAALASIELIESILGQLGVYQHAVAKRTELAEKLVEQRFNTEHVRAILGKFGGKQGQGGIVMACLQGDWRVELDTWAFREVAKASRPGKGEKESPEARAAREEREGLANRARWNGRSPDEQRAHDIRGALWERINYGRRLPTELQSEFGMDALRIVDELRLLQAEEPHRDFDALLAEVAEFRERKGWPGSKQATKTVLRLVGAATPTTQSQEVIP